MVSAPMCRMPQWSPTVADMVPKPPPKQRQTTAVSSAKSTGLAACGRTSRHSAWSTSIARNAGMRYRRATFEQPESP